jgi:hypothetical protein
MIIEVANAVSDDHCRLLIAIHDRRLHLTNAGDKRDTRFSIGDQLRNAPSVAEIVPRLVEKCLCNIRGGLPLIRFMLKR